MKVIIILAILGLSLAGFRADLKKAGHFLKAHGPQIAHGVETGVEVAGDVAKVAGMFAADSMVNVAGLIQDGIKTVGDVTQKNKNIGTLIQDGLKIVGDLTAKNGNTEELFSFGSFVDDATEIASTGVKVAGLVAEDSFVNVAGLIQDGIKTVGDVTQKKKNVVTLIQDGLKIVGDLTAKSGSSNTEELFSFGSFVDDATEIASTGVKVAGLVADASEFVNVGGLIQDGIKTVGDVTQKKKNVGALIQDGLKIIGDLTAKSGSSNTEELFSFGSFMNTAGQVAGAVGTGVEIAGLFA